MGSRVWSVSLNFTDGCRSCCKWHLTACHLLHAACSLKLATCNAEVAFQNIKSLALLHPLGEAVVACRKIYKSDNLIYHCTLSSNESAALGYSTYIYMAHGIWHMEYGIWDCCCWLVRQLLASQNRSWNYQCECNVPYFRPFLTGLLVLLGFSLWMLGVFKCVGDNVSILN